MIEELEKYNEYWNNKMDNKVQSKQSEARRLIYTATYFYLKHINYDNESGRSQDCCDLYDFMKTTKRPYGNKCIEASIAFNLGWGGVQNDYMNERAIKEAMDVHNIALEMVLDKNNDFNMPNPYYIKNRENDINDFALTESQIKDMMHCIGFDINKIKNNHYLTYRNHFTTPIPIPQLDELVEMGFMTKCDFLYGIGDNPQQYSVTKEGLEFLNNILKIEITENN